MIPEIGHFRLDYQSCLALVSAVVPAWGAWRRNVRPWPGPRFSGGYAGAGCDQLYLPARAFLQDDFSVAVVANNSNSLLPPIYKFSAVWGNHEGSLLLWALILCLWTAAVACSSPQLPLVSLAGACRSWALLPSASFLLHY